MRVFPLDFSKNVALIYNLFELDSNRKKLINRLYEKLKKRIFESDLHMRYQSILADMERFVNDLEGLSEYMLQYSLDIDVTHFLKFMDVRIAEEEQTFLERLSDHLKLLVDLLGVELIILVNLRSCLDEAEAERWEKADLRRVWAAWADVQVESGATHPHHISLCRGAVVEFVAPPEKPQGWAKVRLIGGAEGFVREGFLGPYYENEPSAGEEELRNSVVEAAKLYMGVQYRWGGKTPQGIDCSGLVGSAYLLNGVKIYRNASIREGFPVHEIDRAKINKGDLLFFKGHVAMYLGDGMYIHSTSKAGSDGVVLNSLCPGHPLYRHDLATGVLAVGSIF